ncbi:MAG: hypothetical protein Q8910_04285 [Bacteroidota bacterium]|nr:hypothetical protein [Bacteroidota bacterium]
MMKDKVWDRIINGTTTKEDEETISLERVFLALCFVLIGLSWFGLCIAAFIYSFIGGLIYLLVTGIIGLIAYAIYKEGCW